MNLPDAVKSCFSKYVTFSGRAPRSEYWYWFLFTIIAGIILSVIDGILGFHKGGLFSTIFNLAILLPGIAVAVRRMHDINRSGWWLLMPILLALMFVTITRTSGHDNILMPLAGIIYFVVAVIFLYWFCTKGTTGDNRFGPDPLAGKTI